MERDELVEEQDRESALLLFRLGRRGRHDRRNVWLGARMDADGAAPLRRAARRLGEDGLVHLRVVGPQSRAGPARLRDEIFQEEDVIAQIRRVAELVRERLVAGDQIDLLVLVLDGLAERVEIAITRDDEPDLDVLPVLVQELQRTGDEDRVRPTLEEAAAHALGDRDRLHPGELEGHEERLVLRRDLLSEDRELHADRAELRGLLQDRLQDRKRRWQRAGGVLAQGVVDVLPVN